MVEEALDIIKQLGFPKKQQNVRSALTLLALLDLRPGDKWKAAKNPLCGITPMMDFFAEHYGKRYAPNSRETVRRQTVHQFLQASLIAENPDRPDRPTNSGRTVYQITSESLTLLQSYGTAAWGNLLEKYIVSHPSHEPGPIYQTRDGAVLIRLPSSETVRLSTGKHSLLVGAVHTEFAPRFVKRGVPIYIGDTAKKFAYFDRDMLANLGVSLNPHGKIPDVIMYDPDREWIFLIEVVTSHGPIDTKRRNELRELFSRAKAGIVYVTAFADIHTMRRYAADISWKTEVWVAENPEHMIHFDGERFLGPYK